MFRKLLFREPKIKLAMCAAPSPRAGVVVVTYNRPAYLTRCLQSIAEQDIDKTQLDVYVMDDTEPSCKSQVEAELGPLETYLAPARLYYVESERRSIGSKRTAALEMAQCDVLLNWDDDDLYGSDRLRRQMEATLKVDATVLTPEAWRFEPSGDTMTWTGVPQFIAHIDPHLELGLELVDEAIASLAVNVKTTRHLSYPDQSYDEDRVFLRRLKAENLTLRRLPPGEPMYTHVKHSNAVANGPLTKLYAADLGPLTSPFVALPLVFASAGFLGKLLRGLLHDLFP